MYCVWGKDTPIGQHISNTQKYGGCRQGIKNGFILYKLAFYGTCPIRFQPWFLLNSENRVSDPEFVNFKEPKNRSQDIKESIPPAFVVWQAGTTNMVIVLTRQAT
jgi:hypothetical protein